MSRKPSLTVISVSETGTTLRNHRDIDVFVPWSTLEAAAGPENDISAEGRALYQSALDEGRKLLDAERERYRLARVRNCRGHVANSSMTRPYSGPVSRDENRAAHGNVCVHESCACGAVRLTNINGAHFEQGAWA